MGEQFEQPGPVPAETARTMQTQADVLLNLGNAVDNQLPSKLFDYFAAGKPVLHLCVIENDPALPYLCDLFPELVPQAVAAEFVRWLM